MLCYCRDKYVTQEYLRMAELRHVEVTIQAFIFITIRNCLTLRITVIIYLHYNNMD